MAPSHQPPRKQQRPQRLISSTTSFLLLGATISCCCCVLFLLSSASPSSTSSPPPTQIVDVILVGATSSLAKKYLFQSFFRAYLTQETTTTDNPKIHYRFYGGATRPMEEGVKLLQDLLASSTSCKNVKGVAPEVCEAKLREYRASMEYVQLRGEAQYKELGRKLQQRQEKEEAKKEGGGGGVPLGGRLFYLAISPDLYPGVAKSIGEYVRPSASAAAAGGSGGAGGKEEPWLRVVFEKPFGRDLTSAEALAVELAQHLREEEIYRVDHYMGKSVVQAILPFRHANKHWLEELWSGKHVAAVEVVMKETEDCEGRTAFYEGYGVIRDVLQNHLTQVLVLLKMDLPSASEEGHDGGVFGSHVHRTAVLKELTLFGSGVDNESRAAIHVGQYEGYHNHVATDRKADKLFVKTTVPTAASVTLGSAHPRWEGVEFVLKAGKALDKRTSYAKVTLKGEGGERPCQILFNIQGGELEHAAIAWNQNACAGLISPGEVRTPPGWVASEKGDWHVLSPEEESLPNAYEVVVEEVLEGDRSMFLGTEELLHQWRVWDMVLRHADKLEPEVYPLGFSMDEIHVTGVWEEEEEVEAEGGVRVEL